MARKNIGLLYNSSLGQQNDFTTLRVLGRTGLGSARFARAGEGGAGGPGPDRFGSGLGGQGPWAGPAWFLKNHDSDGDVNVMLLRNMTVIRMLI